jgi:hypothetical protein
MSQSIPTVHVTNGDYSMVVNKHEFEDGKFKGFELVGKKKSKSEKSEAEKIADQNVGDLKKSLSDLDDEALAEVLEAEKNGKARESAIAAIEEALKAE